LGYHHNRLAHLRGRYQGVTEMSEAPQQYFPQPKRSEVGAIAMAAWLNVPPDKVPVKFQAWNCPATRAAWERVEAAIRADLHPTEAQITAHPKAKALMEALKAAADQLKKVHDDAFNQALGHGLRTTDGRDFSCRELNRCDEVARKIAATLAAMETPLIAHAEKETAE
jgi:hypothetical protein